MGFLTELFANIKEGFISKISTIIISIIACIATYFMAYKTGSKDAEYKCSIESQKRIDNINELMNQYNTGLKDKYLISINEYKKIYESNKNMLDK